MTFDQAIEHVLSLEGGYVWNPKDPGGETNFGISKRTYPQVDIKALTREQAKEIYRKDFWLSVKCDELPARIRLMVFDCAVNQGAGRAVRFLQSVCGVKADGVIGPKTLAAANAIDQSKLLSSFTIARFEHYMKQDTPAPDDAWDHFGKGWAKRLLLVTLLSAA